MMQKSRKWRDPSGAGEVWEGDCTKLLADLEDRSVNLTVTSPPYFNTPKRYQRGKGHHYTKNIGEPLYAIPDCAKVLYPKTHENGFFCLNLAFSYAETGIMRPFRVVERILKVTKWQIVDIVVWHKSNPVPLTRRLSNAVEFIFVFSPNILSTYPYFDQDPNAYIHNVFESSVGKGLEGIPVFPYELPAWFIKIFSTPNDLVCDPFAGRGTTLVEAKRAGRRYIGIELNGDYIPIIQSEVKGIHWNQQPRKKKATGLTKFLK